MGRLHLHQIEDSHPYLDFYRCKSCRTDIAPDITEEVEYSAMNSGLIGARIFAEVINVVIDEKVLRKAGPHTVADVHCAKCMDLLGWKFIEVSRDVEMFMIDGVIQLLTEKLEFCERNDVKAAEEQELAGTSANLNADTAAVEEEGDPGAVEQEQAAERGEEEKAEEQEQAAETGERGTGSSSRGTRT